MNTNLRPRQRQAAALIASGMSGREAARQLSISGQTVSRWQQQPEFKLWINKSLDESEQQASERLRSLRSLAIERLADLPG